MRAVVAFDLDGTLVDSVADLATGLARALHDLKLRDDVPLAHERVRTWVGRGARNLVESALAELRIDGDADKVLARFRARYGECYLDQTTCYPGIVDVTAQLAQRFTLVVATNKPGAFARPLVEALLPGRFACVLGPDDVGVHKPDPRVLTVAAERGGGGALIAYVGDSGVDVATARNAGVRSIAVSWGLGVRRELDGADLVVDDAPALLRALLT